MVSSGDEGGTCHNDKPGGDKVLKMGVQKGGDPALRSWLIQSDRVATHGQSDLLLSPTVPLETQGESFPLLSVNPAFVSSSMHG